MRGLAELYALVYVSSAVRLLSGCDIKAMLERARAHNLREDVTGVLLYSHGNFMHYLEGGSTPLKTVYQTIKADPLHHGVIQLIFEPIEVRQFKEWALAFVSPDLFDPSEAVDQDPQAVGRLTTPAGRPSASHLLVAEFWNRGRGPYAV